MVVRRYRNTYVENPIGGYGKPSIGTTKIPNHKNGHSIRPNKVALKYPNFKKHVNLDAHVRVFNYVIKANANTSESISPMHLVIC